MSDATLPGVRAALVDPGGTTSRPFYTFFQSQATNLSALSERVSAIEATPSGASNLSPNANVVGSYSISVQGTLRTGIVRVLLEGDVEFAGATNYYGSDSTGAKGWYAVSDALADSGNIVKSVDAGGVTSFDLTDVTVGSAGTLQKYGFDAKGRLSNQSSATTSDLSEGSNLYFTDERAQDAIGAALDGTGNVPLAYDDAGNKISAALSSGVLTSLTLADSAVQSVVAGTGVSVDNTDPHNPVISTTGSGSGDVVGPASATNSAVALFDGTTGKLLKDGGALDKAAVGLGNVDNTSDVNKPVSTAQQAALNTKAPLTQIGTYASRPAASTAQGVIYYATDVQEAYRSDGTTWTVIPSGGTEIGYAEITTTTTTTSTTAVDIAGLSVTCVVGERPVVLSYGGAMRNSLTGDFVRVQAIANGFNTSNITVPGTGNYLTQTRETRVSGLTPGTTYTFKLQIMAIGGGSAQLYGDANDRPYLQVRTT